MIALVLHLTKMWADWNMYRAARRAERALRDQK